MAEQININVNVEGQVELGNVSKKVEELGKNTNKTTSYIAELRKQLKDAKSAMLQAEEGTAEYNNALARVAEIQFRIKDSNDKARLAIMDMGTTARNVGRVMGGLSGAFTTAAGTLSLFAGENEQVLMIIQKVQAAMAVTQGILAFAESIDDLRDLMTGLSASSKIATTNIQGLNDAVATSSQNYSVASSNIASNVTSVKSITEVQTELKKTEEDLFLNSLAGYKARKLGLDEEAISHKKISTELKNKKQQLEDEIATQSTSTNAIVAGNEKISKSFSSVGANILKSFGWTAAITLAISGIIYLVSSLIEYLTKIPKDLEIKLKLNEDVFNKMSSVYEKLMLFAVEYNTAVKKGDKEKIKSLDEIAAKEYGINKDRLVQIGNNVNAWKDAFKEYLKIAEATYFNEALAKAKADVMIKQAKAAADRKAAVESTRGKQTDFVVNKLDKGQLSTIEVIGMGLTGVVKKMNEANDSMKEANKEMETYNKIAFKSVYTKTPITTTSATTTSATTIKVKPVIKDISLDPNSLKSLENVLSREAGQEISKIFKKAFTDIKFPSTAMKTEKLIGLGPDYYQKQIDNAQYSYDRGISDYETFLNTKNNILKNAEGFGLKMTETSFQTQQQLAEYHYQKMSDQIGAYQNMLSSLSTITDSFASIYDSKKQTIDNYYSAEKALIEQSTMTEEEKNAKLAQLDQERYKKQKAVFEQSKKVQIAGVMLGLASGLMGAYVRAVDPKNPIPTPLNWVEAGLEAAALVAQSVASVAAINAQTIEAPNSGGSGSSTMGTSSNISLSPSQTSMTSNVENLNKMITSKEKEASIVKVSDINEVQNTVSVREKNQTF